EDRNDRRTRRRREHHGRVVATRRAVHPGLLRERARRSRHGRRPAALNAQRVRRLLACLLAFTSLCAAAADKPAAVRVERNVIYGMYSGAALLLDVYQPA